MQKVCLKLHSYMVYMFIVFIYIRVFQKSSSPRNIPSSLFCQILQNRSFREDQFCVKALFTRKVSFQSYHFHVASLRHDSFKSCWKSLRSSCVAALNSGSLNWCALVTSNERSTCESIMHDKWSTPFCGAGLVRSNRHKFQPKESRNKETPSEKTWSLDLCCH